MEIVNHSKLYSQYSIIKIVFVSGKNILRGTLYKHMVPEFFKNKFEDIVDKSFKYHQDESINIYGNFAHNNYKKQNTYIISLSSNKDDLNKFVIKIPLYPCPEQCNNYINKNVSSLTEQIISFESEIERLKSINNLKKVNILTKQVNSMDKFVRQFLSIYDNDSKL